MLCFLSDVLAQQRRFMYYNLFRETLRARPESFICSSNLFSPTNIPHQTHLLVASKNKKRRSAMAVQREASKKQASELRLLAFGLSFRAFQLPN